MPGEPDLASRMKIFAQFLEDNPYSRIGRIEQPSEQIVLFSPWGDNSVLLLLDSPTADLARALNGIVLPEQFSAVYHKEKRALEFIYTAFPLSSDIADREFDFIFNGKSHRCSYAKCSDNLLIIAEHFRFGDRPTNTDHRNLAVIQQYVMQERGLQQLHDLKYSYPTSFWVENVDLDDRTIEVAHHINFHMAYFDVKSPLILIHTRRDEGIRAQPQTRYRHSRFPKIIRARRLDNELYHFWSASRSGDPARRFLYNYQVLEYAAHYILDDSVKGGLGKILRSPHILDDLDASINKIVDAISLSKIHDSQKVDILLQRAVDPRMVWREVDRNIDFFEQNTIFEGGFEVKAIAKKGWSAEDFARNWPGQVSVAFRSIRNGLSHAKRVSDGGLNSSNPEQPVKTS